MRRMILPNLLLSSLLALSCSDQGEPLAPENNSPVARDDAYILFVGETLTVTAGGAPDGVLANDSDADGDELSAEVATGELGGPEHGTLTLELDGSFVYAHTGGVAQSDTFHYLVTDVPGGFDLGTVVITITESCAIVVSAPAAAAELTEGESATIAWTSIAGAETVAIELHDASGFLCTIAADALNTGSFAWTVETCGAGTGDGFRIRVADADEAGCEAMSGAFAIVPEWTVSFAAQVQPIFSASCGNEIGCHGNSFPDCGLNLTNGLSHAQLVGIAAQCSQGLRVVPEEPVNSVLYNRVLGSGLFRMPPGGSLTSQQIELIRTWIEEGALDN